MSNSCNSMDYPCWAPLSMGSPGKNTGVGCHFFLQGIVPAQGSNSGLLHCRQILYWLSHQGSIGRLYIHYFWCCLVVSVVSDSLWLHEVQHARLPCPSPTLRAYSNSFPLHQWCHPTISSSVIPFFPAFNLSQHQGLFKWVHSSFKVAKVLEFQLQHQSFQWTFRTDFL